MRKTKEEGKCEFASLFLSLSLSLSLDDNVCLCIQSIDRSNERGVS
mgnify:CR=1 FL=1